MKSYFKLSSCSFRRQWIVLLSGFLGWWSVGQGLGWSSASIHHLKQETDLQTGQIAWVITVLFFGICAGAPISSWSADKIGPNWTLTLACACSLACWAILYATRYFPLMMTARFLYGLWIASVFTVLDRYVEETVSSSHYKRYQPWFTVMIYVGSLYVNASGTFWHYDMVAICCFAVTCLLFVCLLLSSESPYFYVSRGNKDAALSRMVQLQGGYSIQSLDEIEEKLQNRKSGSSGKSVILEFFTEPATRTAFTTFATISILHRITGLTVFIVYAAFTIPHSRLTHSVLVLNSIWILLSSVSVFITPLLKRKTNLGFAFLGSALSILVSIIWYSREDEWLILIPFVFHAFFYFLGIDVMPGILKREILEERYRESVVVVVTMATSILTAVVVKAYLKVAEVSSIEYNFLVCCVMSIVGLVFVLSFFTECKDMAPEDFRAVLERKKDPEKV